MFSERREIENECRSKTLACLNCEQIYNLLDFYRSDHRLDYVHSNHLTFNSYIFASIYLVAIGLFAWRVSVASYDYTVSFPDRNIIVTNMNVYTDI